MRRAAASGLRFLAVGVLGFAVDAGGTEALVAAGLDPLTARLAALTLAMAVTFALNRSVTWRSAVTGRGIVREAATYVAVALGAAAFNYAVYALLVMLVPGLRPAVAAAAGSLAAMTLSYAGYSRLVFTRRLR